MKWIEDRRENLLAAGKSRREHADVRMAFDEEGTILAAGIDFTSDCGAYPTPWPVVTAAAVGMLFPGPYRVPKASFATKTVYTNTAGRTAYRGPWQFETLAREVLLDIAARRMGIDPVELRRRNLLRADELPYTNPNGMTYDSISPLETFEHALELLGYDAFRRRAGQAAPRRAATSASGISHLRRAVDAGLRRTTPPRAPRIRIEPSGKVNVYIAGGSTGNSIETTVVQLTADALGVDIDDVATIQGDTAVTGFGAGTAGSRSGSMTAGAVGETAAILRERLVAIAAHKLEAAPEDIELAGEPGERAGHARRRRLVRRRWPRIAYFEPQPAAAGHARRASRRAPATRRAPARSWVNATHVCTCEVDVATGQVTLLRYIVSEDCGPMINPNVVEGQIAGGTVQGIGGALLEHLAYDEDGNPLATTFMDYLVPTSADVPIIEYGHVETPSPGPGGYKGVGEGGAIGAPPAVVNAVGRRARAASGCALTELPLTPSAIVALLA